MLVSILLILMIAAGGFALTYVFERDEFFLWRVAAGSVIGSCVYGTLAFVFGCFAGIIVASPVALALTLTPLLLFRSKERRRQYKLDWQRAKNRMQGGSAARILSFSFYAFFVVLFCVFFSQAMYETSQGIFTGGSNNLGDLPFHLGAIFSFTEAGNLPAMNPSFAGARFSYPFIADMVTAGFMKLGADVRNAMVIQDVAWAFSLLIILERFVAKLAGGRLAGKFAPWLLFFSGGLGFIWFLQDYWAQGKGFFDFLKNLPRDYTIGQNFRWGNSLITLFITQRSLLLGMPLTVIVLGKLWDWFEVRKVEAEKSEKAAAKKSRSVMAPDSSGFVFSHFKVSAFIVGLIAGMLPLVHLHSLAVLFIVTIFVFGLNPENWRTWIAFGAGVAIIAIPELIWSITGSATRASEFFEWWFGWDKGEDNVVWFWFKNTGLTIPLILLGIYLYLTSKNRDEKKLWLFYTPFVFCFLLSNAAKLAPWQWDNIKVLIYWYIGSLPFIALALVWMWQSGKYLKAAAIVSFAVLIFSGALDVYRTATGQVKTKVFDQDAVRIAEQIRSKTPPKTLFLNAATYNTAVALSGRQSLMRYPGHLSSHGIDYQQREHDVEQIYQGGPAADELLARYNIDYVLISQEETDSLTVNQEYFMKFPLVAQAGNARVYKIK
jgi:hypothetical protein